MNRILALSILLVFANTGVSSADIVRYEFSGVIPVGASAHSQISVGESWVASFLVDDSVADAFSDPNVGIFPGVLSGEFSFSGGFSQVIDVTGWGVVVVNDAAVDPGFADVISIREIGVSTPFPLVQAHHYDTTPPSLLVDDSLPIVGTAFASQGLSVDPASWLYQLRFEDQQTGEFVDYDTRNALNTSLRITSIPEPGSGVFLTLLVGLGFLRRRTSAN